MEAVGGVAESCVAPSSKPEPRTIESVLLTDMIDVSSLGHNGKFVSYWLNLK
jgi:hypothetical protein